MSCPLLALVIALGAVSAQTVTIRGTVLAQGSAEPLSGALVSAADGSYSARSGADGTFVVASDGTVAALTLTLDGFVARELPVPSVAVPAPGEEASVSLGTIFLASDGIDALTVLDRNFTQDDQQADDNQTGASATVASLLSASRDPFLQAAAFNFNATRFRIRGYDNRYTESFIDGAPVNDPEADLPRFYIWGGLNDVTRNRFATASLAENPFDPTALGGVTDIDLRAGSQRAGTRVSIANSNRTWRVRAMATHNSGWLPGGLAYSLSVSTSQADRGYVPGTYMRAFGYYAALDKRFGESHRLNASVLASPSLRGGVGSSIPEVYELSGDPYFNPNWGYQAGEVRNSREYRTHQPVISLGHEWSPRPTTSLRTNLVGITGRNGQTRLERANAPNPLGTYYQYLPSYSLNDESRARVVEAFRQNPSRLQIDWDELYAVNARQRDDITDVGGIEGLDVTGARARYWVEEQRYDPRRLSLVTRLRHALTSQWTLHAGLIAQRNTIRNYQVLDDLLGADFLLNSNAFAERDLGDPRAAENDVDRPRRLVREGQRFGYDYTSENWSVRPYSQIEYTGKRFDVVAAGGLTREQQWRVGNVRNGQFPDRSLGGSERVDWTTGTGRAGVTYKVNGRNYLIARGFYATRAPDFRDVFVSPRTRDDVVAGLVPERITSAEATYQYQAPGLRAKLTGYRTTFSDRVEMRRFFIETAVGNTGFGTYVLQGIDSEHLGLEAAVEYDLTAELEATVALAAGRYVFTNRPVGNAFVDNSNEQLVTDELIYQVGFYDAATPQQVGSASLRYQGRRFYTVTLTGAYARYAFADINPRRRTADAVRGLAEDPARVAEIIDQRVLPGAFTLDLFASKSFKVRRDFIYVTLGVNNLLNNRGIVNGEREQLRFDFQTQDPTRFPNQNFVGFGTNYFLQAAYQF